MLVDAGSPGKGQGMFSFRAVISCLEKRFPVMSENEHSAVASLGIMGFGCVRGCDPFFFHFFFVPFSASFFLYCMERTENDEVARK